MKIAHINQPWDPAVPPVNSSSVAILIYQVARRLAQNEDILVYGSRSKREDKALYYEGVNYRYFGSAFDARLLGIIGQVYNKFNKKQPFFASYWYYLGYIFGVARDLASRNYDIVHIHNFSQFVPIIKAMDPGIKIVLHMHCEWLNQLDESIIASRLSYCDLIIGCSEYITHKIANRFPQFKNICQTIYNGADVDYFTPNENSGKKSQNGINRLLFVGRVSPEKGVHILLEAMPEVINRYPQVQLEIVGPNLVPPAEFIFSTGSDGRPNNPGKLPSEGDGSYLDYIQRLTSSLNLAGHVRFVGPVPQSDLLDYYRAAGLLVAPSLCEALGMMNVEAMACGLPVVSTLVGGIPESVETEKTGLLVPPGNPSALAQGIIRLLDHENLRRSMAKNSRDRAIAYFSWERINEQLLNQYSKILGISAL